MTRRAHGERRREPRLACDWLSGARLRPGHDLEVIDLSSGGALVEAPIRLLPGSRVEIVLAAPDWHWKVLAYVVRCEVWDLSGHGARYRAGLRFGERMERPPLGAVG